MLLVNRCGNTRLNDNFSCLAATGDAAGLWTPKVAEFWTRKFEEAASHFLATQDRAALRISGDSMQQTQVQALHDRQKASYISLTSLLAFMFIVKMMCSC